MQHSSCSLHSFFGALRLNKVLLRLQEVSTLEHHSLGLVENREVEHTRLCGGGVVLNTTELVLDSLCNQVEELIAHCKYKVDTCEVVGLQHLIDASVELRYGVVDSGKVLHLLLAHTAMVVELKIVA